MHRYQSQTYIGMHMCQLLSYISMHRYQSLTYIGKLKYQSLTYIGIGHSTGAGATSTFYYLMSEQLAPAETKEDAAPSSACVCSSQ